MWLDLPDDIRFKIRTDHGLDCMADHCALHLACRQTFRDRPAACGPVRDTRLRRSPCLAHAPKDLLVAYRFVCSSVLGCSPHVPPSPEAPAISYVHSNDVEGLDIELVELVVRTCASRDLVVYGNCCQGHGVMLGHRISPSSEHAMSALHQPV